MPGGNHIRPGSVNVGGSVRGLSANSGSPSLQSMGQTVNQINAGKIIKEVNLNHNNGPQDMTRDEISAEVGNLLGGDQSHPASSTLGAISGIVNGNWEDAKQPELNNMIGMVSKNLETKGIDTRQLKDLFNKALTFLPERLTSNPIE